MGVVKFFSGSSMKKYSGSIMGRNSDSLLANRVNYNIQQNPTNLPNPKPDNYSIIKHEQIGKFLIVKIKYHDCTNYEGNKILIYEHCTIYNLLNQKYIDPHFCEDKDFYSPIARFKPDELGWDWAVALCKLLIK